MTVLNIYNGERRGIHERKSNVYNNYIIASIIAFDQCSGTEKPQNKTAASAVPPFPRNETGTKSIFMRIIINSSTRKLSIVSIDRTRAVIMT